MNRRDKTADTDATEWPRTHISFERNVRGADWIVGDVHGEFSALREGLAQAQFVTGRDRLFSVGDLVDRGAQSEEAVEWLDSGRFAGATRGNHEEMMLAAIAPWTAERARNPLYEIWERNGGTWWRAKRRSEEECERWVEAIRGMPCTIDIETDYGTVAVVHAQPVAETWHECVRACAGHDAHDARTRAMWSRMRYGKASESIGESGNEWRGGCADVRFVVCGHTPVRKVHAIDAVWNIDTGACLSGDERALTLMRIDCESPRMVTIATDNGKRRRKHDETR